MTKQLELFDESNLESRVGNISKKDLNRICIEELRSRGAPNLYMGEEVIDILNLSSIRGKRLAKKLLRKGANNLVSANKMISIAMDIYNFDFYNAKKYVLNRIENYCARPSDD